MFSKVFGSFRNLAVAVVAVMVGVVGFVVAPAGVASASVDVYSTPGRHDVNGRQWQTWCEDYSSTVQRCFTEIVSGGLWVHNNLTYLPSDRGAWGSNPLANGGMWVSDGKTWRTVCDTAATGRNGCRNYISDPKRSTWVVNSIIRFGNSSARVDTTWRPPASSGTTYRAAGDNRPIVTHESIAAQKAAEQAAAEAKRKEAERVSKLPKATGSTWNISLRGGALFKQSELDNCRANPGLWYGEQHVVAHNYCNGWESNQWHNMKRGDTVVVRNNKGVVILRGIVDRDFSRKYGVTPNEPYPFDGEDFFWVQTSWKDEIMFDTNHYIVVKKI